MDKLHRWVIFEAKPGAWRLEVYDRNTGVPCPVMRQGGIRQVRHTSRRQADRRSTLKPFYSALAAEAKGRGLNLTIAGGGWLSFGEEP